MIPSGYKENILYSVKPRNGEGDFTFTRASTGTRVNADGFIEEVPWNKSTYSEDFTNGNYVKNNCVVIADQADSPTGTTTADQIDFGSGSGFFYNVLTAITQPSTYSVYVKYIDYQFIQIIGTGDVDHYANFDIQNGIVGNTGSQSTASIVDAGNGWYRCIINYNSGTFAGGARLYKTTSLTASWAGGGGVAGSFYFWGNQLVKGNSPKPYIKTTDRLDIPRLDYSGGATTPTLLLEPQRTNTILNSEDLSQNTILNNASVTTDQTTSPSNIDNADKITFGSGSGFFYKQTTINAASTFSVFLKYDDYQYFQLMGTGDVDHYANFDIQNGVLGNVGSQATAKIEDYGNGWYRCSLSMYAGNFAGAQRVYKTTSLTASWAGGGGVAGSVFAWGIQLESGIYATSYIPTNGTSVTRVADVCQDAGDATIFNDSEGVLFTEIAALADDSNERFLSVSDGTTVNRISLWYYSATNGLAVAVYSGSVAQFFTTTILSNDTDYNKIAIKYKANDFALWVNGVEVATDTSGLAPVGLSELAFDRGDGALDFYGKVKNLQIFKTALTDTELATLTTI